MTQHYTIAGPDIVHEDFDGDLVVLNLQTGQYFGLNKAGAALWRGLAEGQDPDIMAGKAGSDFAATLVGHGLLVAREGAGVSSTPLSLEEAPVVEVFNDLSDLIMADPIHDVDEDAGWPKLPEAG